MLIKFLLWLILGQKLAEPFLTIAPRRTRRHRSFMLRTALNREPGTVGIPVLPVLPARGSPPHKNETVVPPVDTRPRQGPLANPYGTLTHWYGKPIAGVYPGEDDDKACGEPTVLDLVRKHNDALFGVHGRASERDY